MRRVLAAVFAAAALTACASPQAPAPPPAAPDPDLGHSLAAKVGADGIYTHLNKFAAIAAANKGTRADGTPGYQASVDYVANLLRDKGFDVQTPEYVRVERGAPGNPFARGRSIELKLYAAAGARAKPPAPPCPSAAAVAGQGRPSAGLDRAGVRASNPAVPRLAPQLPCRLAPLLGNVPTRGRILHQSLESRTARRAPH